MTTLETNGYAVDTIVNEGLEYAVRHYCDGGTFKDSETKRLWDDAACALNDLIAYLEHDTGRKIDEERA